MILALLGLEGAASARTPTGPATSPEIRLPANAITAVASGDSVEVRAPGLRPEQLLADHLQPGDARSHPDAVRAFIQATTGIRLPDLRPAHSADTRFNGPDAGSEPPPPEGEPEETGTLSYPAPGGDLTGDGLDDILVFEVTLPEATIVLRALRGTNGSELWHLDLTADDALPYPVGDLTGDGLDDLLLWEFRLLEESLVEDCAAGSAPCTYKYDAAFEWTVALHDGRHGRVEWSKRYPGEDHYRYERRTEGTPPVASTNRVESQLDTSNYAVLPLLSGDHDGDDLSDLILHGVDVAERFESEWTEYANRVQHGSGETSSHTATRTALVRGTDGHVLLSRVAPMGPGFAYLEPVDNLVGGGAPDLLWEEVNVPDDTFSCLGIDSTSVCPDEFSEEYTLDVEVVDGQTLQPAWNVKSENTTDAFSMAVPEDVSGDGVDDILMFVLLEGDEPFLTRLLSGKNGNQLWERRQSDDEQWTWDMPLGLGEISGDGTSDLLFGNFRNPLLGDASARFVRVNGRTGNTLFETSHPFKGLTGDHDMWFQSQYIFGMGDVDGDAVHEPLMGSMAAGYDRDPLTGDETLSEVISATLIESGRSTTVLHDRSAAEAFFFEPAPDLDGDGRLDAFEWHFPLEADQDPSVIVHTLAPARTLWSRGLTWDEFWNLWPGGDHDGSAGDELLYARNDFAEDDTGGGRWTSAVASLSGATGAERWRRAA